MKKIIITVATLLAFQVKSQFIKDTVKIGEQIWSTSILDVDTFTNGDTIYYAATHEEWIAYNQLKIPAYCYIWDSVNLGKHYNWYAVNDYRGLAPKGWRIPSKKDAEYLLKQFEKTINPKYSLLERFPIRYLGDYEINVGNYMYMNMDDKSFKASKLAINYWLSTSHEEYSVYSYRLLSFQEDDNVRIAWYYKTQGNCVLLIKE